MLWLYQEAITDVGGSPEGGQPSIDMEAYLDVILTTTHIQLYLYLFLCPEESL